MFGFLTRENEREKKKSFIGARCLKLKVDESKFEIKSIKKKLKSL